MLKIKELIDKEDDEKSKENLKELYKYYENNYESLPRYQNRKDIDISKPPEGLEYRGLGTMESSIHNVLANRMKNNGSSWSIKDADNIAKLLCFKHSNVIDNNLDEILSNSEQVDIVDVRKIIKKQLEEAKKDMNNEIKLAIKEQKKKRKFGGVQSTVAHGGGMATTVSQAIKGLLNGNLLNNAI